MKKIYAFIAVATIGCAAVSAAPIEKNAAFTRLETQIAPVTKLEKEMIDPEAYAKEHNLKPASLQTISRAIEEMQNIAGSYLGSYISTSNPQLDGDETYRSVTLTQEGDVVTFSPFPYTDFLPFDMTMSLYVSEKNPDFSIYQLECPGFGQTIVWETPDGENAGWFLCEIENGELSAYTNDITFFVYEDKYGKPVLMMPYDGNMGLLFGFPTSDNGLSYYPPLIMQPEFWSCNGVSTAQEYDFETGDFMEVEYPFYSSSIDADEDGIDDSVMIFLLNGFSNPVAFYCDQEEMTCIDLGLPIFTWTNSQNGNEYDFFIYPIEEENGEEYIAEGPLTGTISADESNRTVMNLGSWAGFSEELEQSVCLFADNVLTFDYNIFGEPLEGISSASVDNNNAPVEYYNIQGMRLTNPAKGQMIIVKKGDKVSKCIIR